MAMVVPIKSLDELSNRINTICDDFINEAKTAYENFSTACEELAKRTEASPDLDQNAGASIVLGRVKKMMVDAAEVFG